jgi:hypothetical protein
MNSLKTKSRNAAISKTDPLISVLRNCWFVWEEQGLTHAQWFETHKSGVIVVGRVFEFLGLAEPDEQSVIGWKAKPRFFQIAKETAPTNSFEEERTEERTKDDALLVDMLTGIATQKLVDWGMPINICGGYATSPISDEWTEFFEQRGIALYFTCEVLEGMGLLRLDEVDEWQPTPLLRELFTQGALKIANAAPTSS